MVKTWDECGMVIHLMGTLLIGGLRTMPEDMYVIQVLTRLMWIPKGHDLWPQAQVAGTVDDSETN